MKRGRESHGCGEEYNLKKGKREAIYLHYNILAVGLNVKRGRGEGVEHFWEENKYLKLWRWGRISNYRELFTSLVKIKS